MLDLRRLRIFVAVAEGGSFTAAAESLYLTQSAVSQQVSVLEREAGVALFRRLPRGVELTPAGELLLRRARGLFAEVYSTEQALRRYGDSTQEVRLGSFASAGADLLPQALRTFAQRRPGVHVELRWGLPQTRTLAMLRDGELHLLLIWDYDFDPLPVDPGFRQLQLQTDPMVAVVPIDHPCSGQEKISLTELAGERWIARSHRPPYDNDAYAKMLRIAGVEPDIVFRTDDFQSLQGLVAAGFGVSLAPLLSVTPHRKDVALLPFSNPSFARRVTVLILPETEQSETITELIELLREPTRDAD